MLNAKKSLLLLLSFFATCLGLNYLYLTYKTNESEEERTKELMPRTMGTIFLVLGLLKLTDLRSFSKIFAKYDIVAKRVPVYGYLYPFLEILIGLSLFVKDYRVTAYKTIIVLMTIGLLGIFKIMVSKKGTMLRCGCMGSLLHVPLSYVTISENLVMIAMSSSLLLW
jgi:uncharacterized membrane protein